MRAGKEGGAPVNYRLQLVAGEEAEFFLEDWPAGGVAISPHVVGLFDAAPAPGRRAWTRLWPITGCAVSPLASRSW